MTVVETSQEARRPVVAVVVLTTLAAVLFAFGWAAGKVSLPLAWLWTALRVGWHDARGEGI